MRTVGQLQINKAYIMYYVKLYFRTQHSIALSTDKPNAKRRHFCKAHPPLTHLLTLVVQTLPDLVSSLISHWPSSPVVPHVFMCSASVGGYSA